MTDDPLELNQQLIREGLDGAGFAAIAEAQYEDQVVGQLFTRYGLPASVKYRMLREQGAEVGFKQLKLHKFFLEFPTFPVYLHARKIEKIRDDCQTHKLYMQFDRRKCLKVFDEMVDEVPPMWESTPRGLVFFHPYMTKDKLAKGQGMVLHDWAGLDPEGLSTWPRTHKTFRDEDGKLLRALTLEPLCGFLERLDTQYEGSSWYVDG